MSSPGRSARLEVRNELDKRAHVRADLDAYTVAQLKPRLKRRAAIALGPELAERRDELIERFLVPCDDRHAIWPDPGCAARCASFETYVSSVTRVATWRASSKLCRQKGLLPSGAS